VGAAAAANERRRAARASLTRCRPRSAISVPTRFIASADAAVAVAVAAVDSAAVADGEGGDAQAVMQLGTRPVMKLSPTRTLQFKALVRHVCVALPSCGVMQP
jgi:hypothetical protein